MSFPKSYDVAVSATFTLASGSFTNQFNNRPDLELQLKQAKELGFHKNTVSGTTTYYPLAVVTAITVTEI